MRTAIVNLVAAFLGLYRSRFFQRWLLLAIVLVLPVQAQGAASACDPAIKQNPEHPQGYYERDAQLCEGVYETGVSSLGMTLVSFTGPMNGIDMARTAKLQLKWRPVGKGEVRLRGDSLRPRFYYRMDAVRSADARQMVWTNAIPAQHGLRTAEFGILATQTDISGKQVYLPLQVSQAGKASPRTPYLATVISGTEIQEIYVSLAVDGKFVFYEKPLARKPYPPNQPVTIELDQVVRSGSYLLTISAVLRNGSFDSVDVRFDHSP